MTSDPGMRFLYGLGAWIVLSLCVNLARAASITVTVQCRSLETPGEADDVLASVVMATMQGCYDSEACRIHAIAVSRQGNCEATPEGSTSCVLASVRAPHGTGSNTRAPVLPATGYIWYGVVERLVRNSYSSGERVWCADEEAPAFVAVMVSMLTMVADDASTGTPQAHALLFGAAINDPDPHADVVGGGGGHIPTWEWTSTRDREGGKGDYAHTRGTMRRSLAWLGDPVVFDNGRLCIGSATVTGSAAFHVATVAIGLAIIIWLMGQVTRLNQIIKSEVDLVRTRFG